MIGTTHPSDIPGEVRGKSSNEAWAAKHAKRLFCDEMGYDIDHMTVTSCDADTLFHPRYFSALTYYFATNPKRYRTFWQGPIFYYNNVWDVPAPLRIQNSLGGINHLAKLVRKHTVLFPQSTYSLSMRMCHDVGYWDVDVVPEDWHMFLKCFFELGGEPDVQPILLPVGNDGVRAVSYKGTFWEHYQQARRHAWGCSDIPYAMRQFVAHPEIPFLRRLRRTWSLTENHVLWAAQWFLITGVAANMSAGGWGGFLGLHPFAQHNIPTWFITASHWILHAVHDPAGDDDRAGHDDAPEAARSTGSSGSTRSSSPSGCSWRRSRCSSPPCPRSMRRSGSRWAAGSNTRSPRRRRRRAKPRARVARIPRSSLTPFRHKELPCDP